MDPGAAPLEATRDQGAVATPGSPPVAGPRSAPRHAQETGGARGDGRRRFLERTAHGPVLHLPTAVDAVTFLTVFVVLLMAIPSRLVFAPLGAAGAPAQLLGLALLVPWIAHRFLPAPRGDPDAFTWRATPVDWGLLAFLLAALASYVVGTTRPVEGVEVSSADRAMLSLGAWSGILLAALAGIPSRERLDVLLRRVVFGGGALAALGIAQFATGKDLTGFIQIPGLSNNSELVSVLSRNGFSRPAGTAIHPIEFGVTLTLILPLALHYALQADGRGRLRRWFPVSAIALAVPISISRSAVVGTIVVLAFLIPTWPPYRRLVALISLVGLSGVIYVTVPGLLGTLSTLFLGISKDGSAQSRTDSYGLAGEFISRSPVFGRGIGTFLPTYRILDNQYLGTIIETGIVGVVALLGLFVSGIVTGRAVRRRSQDADTRHLAQALSAALAAAGLSFATFDAFGFPMVPSLTFLLFGCVAALWRLQTSAERLHVAGPTGPGNGAKDDVTGHPGGGSL